MKFVELFESFRGVKLPVDSLQIAIILMAILFAFMTVIFKNLLYAAVSFGAMCISLGALYWTLHAHYIGLFQMLIYGGAVLVLFITVIMFTRGEEID